MAKKAGKVAIIYSENVHYSSESKNMAHYLCGLLSSTGYAQIFMLPYSSEGPISDLITSSRKILYYPPHSKKPSEVPASDVVFTHWSVLPDCHMVIVTVNPSDVGPCGNKLSETLQNHKTRIPVFSIQRGVKYGTTLSDEIESKGMTVIEAVVGFAVVIDPKYSAFIATAQAPSIVYARLSKEEVAIADQPLRLLEAMPLQVYFRKFLTPQAWGLMVYEHLHVLNILTRGTLQETLANREWRLLYALLIRESNEVLCCAARGGVWKPDLLLMTSWLSPKLLELLVIMPDPLFSLLFWALGLLPAQGVISPGQLDLAEGRRTMACVNLQELVDVGKRNGQPCPLSELVLRCLQQVEAGQSAHIGGPAGGHFSYHSTDLVQHVMQELPTLYGNHPSMQEMMYWMSRAAAALSLLGLLAFLLYHD